MLNLVWQIGINESDYTKFWCSYDGSRYGWICFDDGEIVDIHEGENDDNQFMKLVTQTYNAFSIAKNFLCATYYEDDCVTETAYEMFEQDILEHMR